jgi:hypothetical protein
VSPHTARASLRLLSALLRHLDRAEFGTHHVLAYAAQYLVGKACTGTESLGSGEYEKLQDGLSMVGTPPFVQLLS